MGSKGRGTVGQHWLRRVLSVGMMLGVVGWAVSALPPQQVNASGVAFAVGDVLAGIGHGQISHFAPTGTLRDTLNTGTGCNEDLGMAFDKPGNLYATAAFGSCGTGTVSKFDKMGNLVGPFGSGYSRSTESITINAAGDVFVGQPDGTKQVLEFSPSGTPIASFSPTPENRGTDWIDLAADQCTLFYTSEGHSILRYNVCTTTQLSAFATGLTGFAAYALRIRPNGEVLVADTSQVVRLDPAGAPIQTYTLPNSSVLFALNLDPDGTSFWTADYFNGNIYKVDIATGTVLKSFTATLNSRLSGLAVFGEICVGCSKVSTSLSGGGKSGTSITVPAGTGVTDKATLHSVTPKAGGTVTYTVYSDDKCTMTAASGGTVTVSNASVPPSHTVTLTTAGKYYWQASYSGDPKNTGGTSQCGSELETVTASPPSCSTSGTTAGAVWGTKVPPSDDCYNPPNTKVTFKSSSVVFSGVSFFGSGSATCTNSVTSGTTPATGLGAFAIAPPTFNDGTGNPCTDTRTFTDTITTSGNWTARLLDKVNDEESREPNPGDRFALVIPKAGLVDHNSFNSCTITLAPNAPFQVVGAYDDHNKFVIDVSGIPATATGCVASSGTVGIKATYILTPGITDGGP